MKVTFEQWMQAVDQIIERLSGLTYLDLPDYPYYDWYEANITPKSAATRVLKSEGFIE